MSSLPFRAILYAVLSVVTEFVALSVALLRIDETPLEGGPEGAKLMMVALGIAMAFVFFVQHRLFFGRLRELDLGFPAHLSRAWASYLLIPLGMVAENIGITGSGAVILPGRSWFEVMWNGPAVLALIPVVVDLLRLAVARMMAMSTGRRAME